MPVQLTTKIGDGARIVSQGAQNLRLEIPKIGAQKIYEALQKAQKGVTHYPPELRGQRYKRTGRYGKAWRIERKSNAWVLRGNAVGRYGEYTKYVGGSARGQEQAKIHSGRWLLMRDAVDKALKPLPKTIKENIVMVARRTLKGK